jgi:glycosyltransferase involved in cell wall biosynthesis
MKAIKFNKIRYSIVVPFYNEENSISVLYGKIVEVMDSLGEPYEMVFVDDGSTDDTYRVLTEILELDGRVVGVKLRRNFGQTPALKAGFDHARGEIIISMDGDLQHEPAEIPDFIEKMNEGYDIVSGWRVDRLDSWFSRRLPSSIANWLMAKLSGVELHDFGTTFKAYRHEVVADLQLYGELHRFIPALASITGATIAEIPITNVPRRHGKSNYSISRTFRVLFDLISIKFLLTYSTRPLHFFGLFGLAGIGLGTALSGFMMVKKLLFGTDLMDHHGPLLFLATLFLLSGVQLLSIGLLGEILSRTYYESQNKPIYAVREVRRLSSPNNVAIMSGSRAGKRAHWAERHDELDFPSAASE